MTKLLRYLLALIAGRASVAESEEPLPVLWMPSAITAEIRADNVYLKIGKYLHLEQRLAPGQYGWTMSKLEIPDSWPAPDLFFREEQLVLRVKDVGEFQINAFNMGPLSYGILCAGEGKKAPDARLAAIWAEYASPHAANRMLQPTSGRDAAFPG